MTKTIVIEGMSCEHCVARVKAALEQGGASAAVDLETKTAVVTGENLDGEQLRAVVEKAGYEVIEVR